MTAGDGAASAGSGLCPPARIDLGAVMGKRIEEYVGRRADGEDRLSIARIHSPQGWSEGGQRAAFDEFFLVLSGAMLFEFDGGCLEAHAGQAVVARAGQWVRHSTPHPGGAEYVAVCTPAYGADRVDRDDGGATAKPTIELPLTDEELAGLRRIESDHLWHPWSPIECATPRRLFVRGEGCHLIDAVGRRFLDARSSSFNVGLGYGRSDVVSAVARQLAQLMTFELVDASTAPPILLAGKLASLLPARLQRCFFFSSGSEAVEATLKMARMYHRLRGEPDRSVLLGFRGGYHGPTLGAMGLYGSAFHQTGAEPLPGDFGTIPHPGADTGAPKTAEQGLRQVEEAFLEAGGPSRVAAVVLEPVQGNGGVRLPPEGYLAGLRELCTRHGILLVFDEIMTGCGRTGRMFAFEHWGVVPDVLLLSKCLTGGYMPLSVMVTGEEVYQTFRRDTLLGGFRHGNTCTGHAAACAAALAVLQAMEREAVVANCARQGEAISDRLRHLLAGRSRVREVRGLGLLIGIDLGGEDPVSLARSMAARAAELGLLVRQAGPVLIIAPPLVLQDAERRHLLAVLEQVFVELLDEDS